jgi:hypothetical protein
MKYKGNQAKREGRTPIPFDDVAKRLLNTPPFPAAKPEKNKKK